MSLLALLRSPARTVLTFVLLAAVSFAFFMQVSQYAVTKREFNKAALQYRGVGAAEVAPPHAVTADGANYLETDPRISGDYSDEQRKYYYMSFGCGIDETHYQPLTREQTTTIMNLPYIARTDMRYMTAGMAETYFRVAEGRSYYPYTARCIIEAKLIEVQYGKPRNDPIRYDRKNDSTLLLEKCSVLAGNCPYVSDSDMIEIHAINALPYTISFLGLSKNTLIEK